jgi:hypothetical protein
MRFLDGGMQRKYRKLPARPVAIHLLRVDISPKLVEAMKKLC